MNKDIDIVVVDMANKTIMKFKNGSLIELSDTNPIENVRGRRSEITHFHNDFEVDRENIDEAIKNIRK